MVMHLQGLDSMLSAVFSCWTFEASSFPIFDESYLKWKVINHELWREDSFQRHGCCAVTPGDREAWRHNKS
jgi:hypothetical protein